MCLGVLQYENGDVYTGEFIANKHHGQGTMVFKNGSVFEGIWSFGDIHDGVAYKTAECTDHTVFVGTISNGRYNDR